MITTVCIVAAFIVASLLARAVIHDVYGGWLARRDAAYRAELRAHAEWMRKMRDPLADMRDGFIAISKAGISAQEAMQAMVKSMRALTGVAPSYATVDRRTSTPGDNTL